MLVVVSPAKNLDFESVVPTREYTQPALLDETERLMKVCRTLSPADLASLMKISDKLATLNANRFAEFSTPFTPENARQAMYAFNGDVYTGLDAHSLDTDAVAYAQNRLRILSGLYGLLLPLDLMQAYRLEMGTKLANPAGKDLYAFWNDTITLALNKALEAQGDNVLINLASNEYFKSVHADELEFPVMTPIFLDRKDEGDYKTVSFYAKRARGSMASWIIRNRVSQSEQFQEFAENGYEFCSERSKNQSPVFIRTNS